MNTIVATLEHLAVTASQKAARGALSESVVGESRRILKAQEALPCSIMNPPLSSHAEFAQPRITLEELELLGAQGAAARHGDVIAAVHSLRNTLAAPAIMVSYINAPPLQNTQGALARYVA